MSESLLAGSTIASATTVHWYGRPSGDKLVLRAAPRPASWNRSSDPDRIALREYLTETVDQAMPLIPPTGPWAMCLEVGVPPNRALTTAADLDNYAKPLASALPRERLIAVWCSKRHAESSHLVIGPVQRTSPPSDQIQVRTTASADTVNYKQQVRDALSGTAELVEGPVRLQIAFGVGPTRNWLNLWKPTIDALDPLLGRTYPDRDWHPRDDRIVDLGLQVTVDPRLRFEVELSIAATAPSFPEPG